MAPDPRKKFNSSVDYLNDGVKQKAKDETSIVKVKVRATRTGYYDLKLRHEGDAFTVRVNTASKGRDGMLPSWVEAVEETDIPTAPIPETQETAHLRGNGVPSDGSADPDAVI